MSTIKLHRSDGVTTTLPTLGLDIPVGFGVTTRIDSQYLPGNTTAFLVGDGVDLAGQVILRGVVQKDSESEAAATITSLLEAARLTLSIQRLSDRGSVYRAVNALVRFTRDYYRVQGTPVKDTHTFEMVFDARYGLWTTTRADSDSAYGAATQVMA